MAFGVLPQAAVEADAELVAGTHPRAGGVTMAADGIYSTLIIGAGFTGLGAAIRLAESGVTRQT